MQDNSAPGVAESPKQQLFRLYARSFCSAAVWRMFGNALRIVSYHGVCQDEVLSESGIPTYFVSRSAFEQHLAYLVKHARLMRLSEAVPLLIAGRLPARATCIGFDDGYANNLHVAVPLLQKYSVPATVFVATGCIRTGELLPFDKVRLVNLFEHGTGDDSDYYQLPIDELERRYACRWNAIRRSLPARLHEALRPLTLEELRALPKELIEIGAHSRSHCFLPNETPERRKREILDSLKDVSEWTGNAAPLFAYPNGAFSEFDKRVLEGVAAAAVTTVAGRNLTGDDPLELKRYPIGSGHELDAFIAEVTGFRSWLLSLLRESPPGKITT